VKNRESQVGELDKLKLKTTVLYGDRDEEVHMTQPSGFVAAKSVQLFDLGGAHLAELCLP